MSAGSETSVKHTPGPWRVERDTSDDPQTLIMAGSVIVGEAYESAPVEESLRQAEANARLIAAAPELLEGARAATAWWVQIANRNPDLSALWVRTLNLAIAKATQP